jgi:hypothetical protein
MRTRTGPCCLGIARWRRRRASVDGVLAKHHTFAEPCEVETLMHGSAAEMGSDPFVYCNRTGGQRRVTALQLRQRIGAVWPPPLSVGR